MDDKETIYKLLQSILVEIREEGNRINHPVFFQLADFFCELPPRLEEACETDDYDTLMEWLMNRAKGKPVERWMNSQIQHIKQYYPSDPND